MISIDEKMIAKLAEQAAISPRRRMHHNLHQSYADPSQQLLNFIFWDSYIPPHRHLAAPKPETLIALRGDLGCLVFDNAGQILRGQRLTAGGVCAAVVIEPDEWHTVIAISETALLFETKAGPFDPMAAKELAPWAISEGDAFARGYLELLRSFFS